MSIFEHTGVFVQFKDDQGKEVVKDTYSKEKNIYQVTEFWHCRFDVSKEEVKSRCLISAQCNIIGLLNDSSKPCVRTSDNKLGVIYTPKTSLKLLGDSYLKAFAAVTSPELYDNIIYPLYQDLKLLATNQLFSPFNPVLKITDDGKRQYRQDVVTLEKLSYQECIERYEESLGEWMEELEREEMSLTETKYLASWDSAKKWMIYLREREPSEIYPVELINEINTKSWHRDDLEIRNNEFISAVETSNIPYMITLLRVGVNLLCMRARAVRLMDEKSRESLFELIKETRADKIKKRLRD